MERVAVVYGADKDPPDKVKLDNVELAAKLVKLPVIVTFERVADASGPYKVDCKSTFDNEAYAFVKLDNVADAVVPVITAPELNVTLLKVERGASTLAADTTEILDKLTLLKLIN